MTRWAARLAVGLLCAAGLPTTAVAQQSAVPTAVDSTAGTTPITPTTPRPPQPREYFAYYGGSFAISYWDGDARFMIQPNVAWSFRPRVAAGLGASYEFVSYDSGEGTANNYGGSLFTRYSITPRMYGRAEFEMRSLDSITTPAGVGRETVEFMWLGGGISTSMGQRSSAYAEVLFDLVQDALSPYEGGRPLTRVGVTFAF